MKLPPFRAFTEEQLNETIGAIYEGTLVDGDLPSVLHAVGIFCGAITGALVSFDREKYNGLAWHSYGYPDGQFDHYVKHLMPADEAAVKYINSPQIEVFEESMLIDEKTKAKSTYFDWERKTSNHSYRFGARLISGKAEIGLTLGRSASQGRADIENLKRLKLLVPHLRRCLLLSRRSADGTIRILETLAYGVAIVDSDCKVYGSNKILEDIGKANDGINIARGALQIGDRIAKDLIERTVRQVASGQRLGDEINRVVVPIQRPSGLRPYMAIVTPIPEKSGSLFITDGRVMISFSDPERRLRLRESALVQAFGLTASEAQLAQALVEYGDLPRAANACGLTPGSARQYIKRIFSKTSTHGQVELVALIMRLAS